MINKIQIGLIFLIIPLGIFYWYLNDNNLTFKDFIVPGTPVLHIGDLGVRVNIANSEEERISGLSGKDALTGVDGLLFVFPESEYHSIWMKDMRFAIDIIWISDDLEVISINQNIGPETYPTVFRPTRPARYVVETNAHYVDTFGIKPGQKVRLPYNYEDK